MDDGIGDTIVGVDEQRPKRRRRRRWYQKLPLWTQEYAVEIGMVAAILLAVFLLVEPWAIRETLFRLARRSFEFLYRTVWGTIITFVKRLTLSDATAFLILLGVLLVAVWRVRWRIVHSERFWSTHCPRCDSYALRRIRRRWHDRLIVLLGFPVRRYRCGQCSWRGLRVPKHASAPRSFPQPPSSS